MGAAAGLGRGFGRGGRGGEGAATVSKSDRDLVDPLDVETLELLDADGRARTETDGEIADGVGVGRGDWDEVDAAGVERG